MVNDSELIFELQDDAFKFKLLLFWLLTIFIAEGLNYLFNVVNENN